MIRMPSRYGPLIVAAVAIIVYANSIANGFAYDDIFIIETNSRVHDLADLRSIWLRPYWPLMGEMLGLWRPLTIFGYALQWAISPEPWLFHTVNVLMHAAATVLVYLLLVRLTASVPGSLVGALLFAVHPVHTEAVANVVGQAELIAAITTFGACLIHMGRPRDSELGWGRRIAILTLFLVGILAKESAIVLPGLLVALDLAQGRLRLERASLAPYLRGMGMPLFLCAAVTVFYFAYRVDVLGSIGGIDAAPALTFLKEEHRVLVAFRAWLEYVRLLVLPLELSADYSPGVILPVDGWSPMVVVGAVTFIATALLAALTPWSPKQGLPAAWLLISALPTSNLLMPIGVVVAERLLYTPSFCISLIAAWLTHAVVTADLTVARRRLITASCLLLLLLFGARTVVRNPDWDSTPAVLDAIARDHPESYRVHWRNGSRALAMGHLDFAEESFRFAYRIWRHDPALVNALADILMLRGDYDEAVSMLEEARTRFSWMPESAVQLSHAYVGAGRFDEAIASGFLALTLGGKADLAYAGLAQAWEGKGNLDRAIAAWRAALRDQKTSPSPAAAWSYRARYARTLAQAAAPAEALAALESARLAIPAGDSLARAEVDTLHATISRGCHVDRAGETPCPDPIGDWRLVTPTLIDRKNATPSQNAMEHGVSETGADMR